MNFTNRGGLNLYCLVSTTLRVRLLLDTILLHSHLTINTTRFFFLITVPPEFMTCRRQHGCNRHPGKSRKAGRPRRKKTTTYVHGFKAVVYCYKLIPVRDILVHLHFSLQVICAEKGVRLSALRIEKRSWILTLDNTGQFCAPFHSPECAASPNASSDQLEAISPCSTILTKHENILELNSRPCGNLLSGGCDTDDGRDAPAFMACLKRSPHDIDLKKGRDCQINGNKTVALCLVVACNLRCPLRQT